MSFSDGECFTVAGLRSIIYKENTNIRYTIQKISSCYAIPNGNLGANPGNFMMNNFQFQEAEVEVI